MHGALKTNKYMHGALKTNSYLQPHWIVLPVWIELINILNELFIIPTMY